MKVVINACFGGFSLSDAGIRRYAEIKGIKLYPEDDRFSNLVGPTYYTKPKSERVPEIDWNAASLDDRRAYNEASEGETLYDRDLERNDPALVEVVEELGDKANGRCAKLSIVEIPNDVEWEISEYDGYEHVAEKHRTWP